MGLISKIIQRHRRLKAVRMTDVSTNEVTFRWSDHRPAVGFRWQEVSEIRTYKVDCLCYDDIRLVFSAGEFWYEVSEQDSAFVTVVAEMEQRFVGIPADWFTEVMMPPFETNDCVLWSAPNHHLQLPPEAPAPGRGE